MENLIFERVGPIGILKINRPQVLNALDIKVLEQIYMLIELVVKGRQVKAFIITGEGDKSFVSGADINEMNGMDQLEALRFAELGQKVAKLLEDAPFISIAAVNGYALGGGLELALACDFIYAASDAKLGMPEVLLGLIPGFGGTQRLVNKIGETRAKELILTGKMISADEAKALGLVSEIFPKADLMKESIAALEHILTNPFTALIQAKRAIQQTTTIRMAEGLEAERNMFAICFATSQTEKLMEEFLEKKGHHANAN